MCAMHAINSLLQRPATTKEYLHDITRHLDDHERNLLHGSAPGEGGSCRPEGDYTIQVILKAPSGILVKAGRSPTPETQAYETTFSGNPNMKKGSC